MAGLLFVSWVSPGTVCLHQDRHLISQNRLLKRCARLEEHTNNDAQANSLQTHDGQRGKTNVISFPDICHVPPEDRSASQKIT
jgi:hypothetical protein